MTTKSGRRVRRIVESDAAITKKRSQSIVDDAIGMTDVADERRLTFAAGQGVGDLVVVEDSATSGQTTNDVGAP